MRNAEPQTKAAVVGRRVLDWALLGIAVVSTYCWCVRISNDLSWDEAGSLRRYARHPLTSGAYMHDSNNHPAESLLRSIFYWGFGLSAPPFYKFAAFLVLLGFLAVAWKWRRHLLEAGAVFGATVMTLLLFLCHVVHEQAMIMRGYFPTIVLGLVYLLLVAKWSNLLGVRADAPKIHRRAWIALAALSALMLWTLPSNLVLMLVLWPATMIAFGVGEAGDNRLVSVLREATKLGLLSGAFAVVLYLPILVSFAMGVSTIVNLPKDEPSPVLQRIRDEIAYGFDQARPDGIPAWAFLTLAGVLLLASLVFRRKERIVQVAWCLMLSTLAVCIALVLVINYPPRIKSPYLVPMLIGLVFLTCSVARPWSARTQLVAGLIAAAIGYAALPAVVEATVFDRRASDIAAFLETYTRPSERRVLAVHDNAWNLRPYLNRLFSDAWTLDGFAEMRQRLSGQEPRAERKIGAIERWLTGIITPAQPLERIKPEDVDVLVLVGQKMTRAGAVVWVDPGLDAIKQRLSKMTRFRRDERDIEVYEKP